MKKASKNYPIGYIIGRAIDNRIGGFMIAEVARLLQANKKKLLCALYIVNAVQEEIGLRGAEMMAPQDQAQRRDHHGCHDDHHAQDQQDH